MEKSKINIVELTFNFAISIVIYCEKLEKRRKFIISNQLLRSGTSIGANVNEAQKAESRSDFIHKMKIADKEAKETEYWLRICERMDSYPPIDNLLLDLLIIQKTLSKIISTSKRNF